MTIVRVSPWAHRRLDTLLAYTPQDRPLPSRRRIVDRHLEIEIAEERCCLYGILDIPGFGQPWVFADNQGQGFGPDDSPIDFALEALRTRIRRVQERVDLDTLLSLPELNGIERRLDHAREHLASATDPAQRSLIAKDSAVFDGLCEAMWAGEELVLAQSRLRIAQRGQRGDFLLGSVLKGFPQGGEAFRSRIKDLFRYATVPLTWGVIEPERGHPHYPVIDEMVSWCQANGIGIKGHALTWDSRWEWNAWQRGLSHQESLRLKAERARDILTRYPGAFDAMELINEPVQANPFGWTVDQILEQTLAVYQVCRELAPDMRLMISFFSEWEQFYAQSSALPPDPSRLISMRQFLDRCLEAGIQFDLIGLQIHYDWDLFEVERMIRGWHRDYAVPIHITEIAVPSTCELLLPEILSRHPRLDQAWHAPWSETTQADWLEQYLTLYHSMPEVEAAVIWGISDARLWAEYLEGYPNEAYSLPWLATQGILRADHSPKPAYQRLLSLARRWELIPEA